MNPNFKKALKIILTIPLTLFVLVALVFGTLTIFEYRPDDITVLEIDGESSQTLSFGDEVTILTWNMGYGGLDESEDFFMDGGTRVLPSSKEQVLTNVNAVIDEIVSVNPDIIFLQEVDRDSKRSFFVNEYKTILSSVSEYNATFANNHKVLYTPYPIPTLGRIDAGMMTLSSYDVTSASRISLPCPFKWPVRIGNLKRCLMVSRIAMKGSDKELVLVNLHLEAYDDGEGKIAQTEQLRQLLEEEAKKGNYVIAGGDFNQSFSNYDNSAYAPVTEDENIWQPGTLDVSEFDENLLTFITDNSHPSARSIDKPYVGADHSTFQYYMIDGFIVSNNVTIDSITNDDLDFKNSDHNPLILKVTID